MAQFEGYERREAKILEVLKEYGISSIDECKAITAAGGLWRCGLRSLPPAYSTF